MQPSILANIGSQALSGKNPASVDLVGSTLAQLFELSRHGLLWLDPRLRIVGHNSVAAQILARNDGVRFRESRLVFARTIIGRDLDAFVTKAHRAIGDWPAGGESTFVRRVERPSGKLPYLLVATRCISQTGVVGVLMLLEDLSERPELDAGVCQAVYALTPAETRVAVRLVDGRSAPGIAQDLQLSPLTVRTHIKRVFKKVGVRSQSQLMAALCRIAFLPVGHGLRAAATSLKINSASGMVAASSTPPS